MLASGVRDGLENTPDAEVLCVVLDPVLMLGCTAAKPVRMERMLIEREMEVVPHV